jgi:hypothetical protein
MLTGKGIWALWDSEVDLAIPMAQQTDATHVLFKTGSAAEYYEARSKTAVQKIKNAGLTPFAWPFIFCDDPAGEAEVAIRTWQEGYEGIVFDIEDQSAGKAENAAELGRRVREAGLDPNQLYFTSFPNLSAHTRVPYKEMAAFCQGGFMPQSYGTFRWPAHYTLGTMTYREYENWPAAWGDRPAIYPILGPYYDLQGKIRMTRGEFQIWADELSGYRPTFYSIFRAMVTDQELWPVLKALRPWRPVTETDWSRAGEAAWAQVAVSTNPDVAFPRKAREVLGTGAFALSDEQHAAIDDHAWAWQLWSDGNKVVILMAQEGHWDLAEIRVVPHPGT